MDLAKWQAVKNNDSTADGKFYYGVKTTGVFCLPSCKSKLPLEKNIVFFDSYQEAVKTGFRPCKRCRPDLNLTYSPNEQLLLEIRDFLQQNSSNPHCLENLDIRFNLSSFYLMRIFKNRFVLTPREYVQNNRVQTAKKLLRSSELKITDIAFDCGFTSYTCFYTNFKRIVGMKPEKYRKGE